MLRVVLATDQVPVEFLARVPAEPVAAGDVALLLSVERDDADDDRELADVRACAAPELVAGAAERGCPEPEGGEHQWR
jgi:hypothetical protein